MHSLSYRDRDHAFGQAMLTLRTRIGLTQAGLAGILGVSRRAVGDWEAGNSYPKSEHLEHFVALAVEHMAFPDKRQAEEIRDLWHAAHQKVLLDEAWLAALLVPRWSEQAGIPVHTLAQPVGGPRLDWEDAHAVPNFYGRQWELNLLAGWMVEEHSRVVTVLGLGGIGKSALAITLMHRVAGHFEAVIWRSLRDLPSCELLLEDLLRLLAPRALGEMPASLEQRQSILLEQMRRVRVLLVFDNLESVLEKGEDTGRMRPGYEGLGRFLHLCAGTEHQSCVLLTGREKVGELVPLEGIHSPVRALRLARLEKQACEALLAENDLRGNESERTRLFDAYAGNPLALKIVAQTIAEVFAGEIAPFLEQGEVIFGGVRELLEEQFNRVSALEQCVLLWLAILREPATIEELAALLVTPVPRARLLDAVEALRRRSLIERGRKPASFTLQSVVLEYMTAELVAQAIAEIQQGKLARLAEHGLVLGQAREYVRQTQEQLIVTPILEFLQNAYPQESVLEKHLLALLGQFTNWSDHAQGYGPANLVTLLRLQRGDLRSLDLSRLALRGAYFQGIAMQDATLSGAMIQDSVLDETFDAIMGLTVNHTGELWAASSRTGEVRLWRDGGQVLHRVWQAHSDLIWSLAFNQDSTLLATGGFDGTLKLWDVASGALRWVGHHPGDVFGVSFAPAGNLVASSGGNAVVIWDVARGTQLQILPHPELVIPVVWNPDGSLVASGDVLGAIRLWEVTGNEPPICLSVIPGHTSQVSDLVFDPDGRILASASLDGTIKLWELPGGLPRATLPGHLERVNRIAWSVDGRLLALGGFEKAIWIWDVHQGRYKAVLEGHSDAVTGLAFTPDGRSVISGGDSTLRVWDIASGRCVRILQGNTIVLFDVDWSPDATQLVSGGSDSLLTIFSLADAQTARLLPGHRGLVFGVAWSPDGRWLASSSWDTQVRLWDPTSGECLQILQNPDDPNTIFYNVAWSPDGQRLACATYLNLGGVLVWDLGEGSVPVARWLRPPHPVEIRRVDWSPDGHWLAGGGYDKNVYVWDACDGALQQQLSGHQGAVKSLAWSPDGTRLASGSSGRQGGELFVWDAQSGEALHNLVGHPEIVYALAWGAGEQVLVSGGDDGMLRWWDVCNGQCRWELQAHQGMVQTLRRSPDGHRLASGGVDGAIRLWDLRSGEPVQTLRRDRPYERLNITDIRGLNEAQKETLRSLGAFDETNKAG